MPTTPPPISRRARRRAARPPEARERPIDRGSLHLLPGWTPAVGIASSPAGEHRPPVPVAPLDIAVARARRNDLLGDIAFTRRMLHALQSVPCPQHGAARGEPCWLLESSTVVGKRLTALCAWRLERSRRLLFDPEVAAAHSAERVIRHPRPDRTSLASAYRSTSNGWDRR